MSRYALAVDIGGTFTDVVLRGASGQTVVDKTLTTPESLDDLCGRDHGLNDARALGPFVVIRRFKHIRHLISVSDCLGMLSRCEIHIAL